MRNSDFGITGVENVQYNSIAAGEMIAGTVAAAGGTAPARLVWLVAHLTNTGTIYVGGSGVTAPDGTADATTGFPLSPGDQFGPLPIPNVSVLQFVASAAGQRLSYFAVS